MKLNYPVIDYSLSVTKDLRTNIHTVTIEGSVKNQNLIINDFKFCMKLLKVISWDKISLIQGKEISCVLNHMIRWRDEG